MMNVIKDAMISQRSWKRKSPGFSRRLFYSIFFAACIGSSPLCASSVFVEAGCIYFEKQGVLTKQLTTGGKDRAPVIDSSEKVVAFIRKSDTPSYPQLDSYEDAADPDKRLADQLWLYDLEEGRDRMLVRDTVSHAKGISDAVANSIQVIDDSSVCFSTDGRRIYFIAGAWVTSGALHCVEVESGKRKFLTSALYVEVIPGGEYKDDLIVQQHRYFPGGGSYDWYWRYSPEGEELEVLADSEECLQGFRNVYYDDDPAERKPAKAVRKITETEEVSENEDPERARLQQALDQAEATPEIAAASYELYEYLDQKLQRLQEDIRKDLQGPGSEQILKRFDQAAAQWQVYRETFADMMWEYYRGGTIRSWMHNGTLINLTEQRIAHLRGMSPEWHNR